jgi:hypothetical protein
VALESEGVLPVKDLFRLTSVDGSSVLEFRGSIPRGLKGYDGATYMAALVGGPISAAVEVHDIQPQRWSLFFKDLAKHWNGWEGVKTHESLEGHLRVACTTDRLGHVTVRVYLRGDMQASDWRAEDSIHLEAGQLDAVAADAQDYFG